MPKRITSKDWEERNPKLVLWATVTAWVAIGVIVLFTFLTR